VFSGICSQMQQSGLYSSYYVIHDQNDLKRFPYQKADGVIVMGKIGSEILHEFQNRNINVVIVDNRLPKVNVSSVNSNNQESVLNAVEILSELGHRRIAFAVLYNKENLEYTFHQRELGYLAGLNMVGLEYDERMLVREHYSNGVFNDFNTGSYENDLTRLSERILQIKPMPTAVIAANDLIAYYIRKVVTSKGLKVPKDLSIIGYDGWHRHSTVSNVGFTPTSTMVVNWEEMGRQAINLIMEIQIDADDQKFRHIELPTEYEDLGTVAAPGR
jgi:LacI family transcriptional regulator